MQMEKYGREHLMLTFGVKDVLTRLSWTKINRLLFHGDATRIITTVSV